jgi:hypothetical protein
LCGIFGGGNIRNQASDVRMLGNRFFDGAGTTAGNEHLVALPGKTQRRRPPDAGAAARHDNDLFTLHVRSPSAATEGCAKPGDRQ